MKFDQAYICSCQIQFGWVLSGRTSGFHPEQSAEHSRVPLRLLRCSQRIRINTSREHITHPMRREVKFIISCGIFFYFIYFFVQWLFSDAGCCKAFKTVLRFAMHSLLLSACLTTNVWMRMKKLINFQLGNGFLIQEVFLYTFEVHSFIIQAPAAVEWMYWKILVIIYLYCRQNNKIKSLRFSYEFCAAVICPQSIQASV